MDTAIRKGFSEEEETHESSIEGQVEDIFEESKKGFHGRGNAMSKCTGAWNSTLYSKNYK